MRRPERRGKIKENQVKVLRKQGPVADAFCASPRTKQSEGENPGISEFCGGAGGRVPGTDKALSKSCQNATG